MAGANSSKCVAHQFCGSAIATKTSVRCANKNLCGWHWIMWHYKRPAPHASIFSQYQTINSESFCLQYVQVFVGTFFEVGSDGLGSAHVTEQTNQPFSNETMIVVQRGSLPTSSSITNNYNGDVVTNFLLQDLAVCCSERFLVPVRCCWTFFV